MTAKKLTGKRSTYLAALQLAAVDDLDALREEFVDVGAIPFCSGVIKAMEPGQYCAVCGQTAHGERWAFRLFAEVAQWVGSGEQVAQTLILQLGAPIADAQLAVEQVASAPKDPHEIARAARNYLAWYEGPSGPKGDA